MGDAKTDEDGGGRSAGFFFVLDSQWLSRDVFLKGY